MRDGHVPDDTPPLVLRRLPHNVEAEMALLGAILVDNRAYERVVDFLLPEHFILSDHQKIFAAIVQVIGSAQIADPVTLKTHFENDDDLTAIGGVAYLIKLADCAVTAINAGDYGRLLHDLYQRRELIALGEDVVNHAYATDLVEPSSRQIEIAQRRLLTLSEQSATRPGFVADDADTLDATPIQPREWLLGNLLCRGYVTIVAAAGGAGKTSLAMGWALSLATGRTLTGDHVHHRSRVLLVTAEDCQDEIRRRLRAARIHHGIDTIGDGWLSVLCLTGSGVTLVRSSEHGEVAETGAADRIAATARHLRCAVIIVDPLIKLSGAPENDNVAVDTVMRLLVRIAQECRVAILALHHVRKGNATPGDTDAARGAGALIAAARVAVTLTSMSADEATAMSVAEDERRRLIRLDTGKCNLSPIGTAAAWYRLASVPLDNGTDAYPSGDTVQAIERWTPPDAWDGITGAVANAILDDFDAGMPDGERYSDAGAAGSRAAWRVVQKHAPQKTDAQCREVIRAWRKTGLLIVEEYESPNRREPAKGLVVDHARRPS